MLVSIIRITSNQAVEAFVEHSGVTEDAIDAKACLQALYFL